MLRPEAVKFMLFCSETLKKGTGAMQSLSRQREMDVKLH